MDYKKYDDIKHAARLFTNSRFKREYSRFIDDILRKLYQPIGKWGKLLVDGNYGVINTEYSLEKAKIINDKVKEFYKNVYNNIDPTWSLLNYVNTNYSSFVHILNTINYWISTEQIKNEDIFIFKTNIFDELERFKNIITKTSEYIFMPQENIKCFYKIMGTIATTTFIGNLGENLTLESLTNLGNVTDIIKSEPGQRVDTHKGVDISFKLNGVKKTIQCKHFVRMSFKDGIYNFRDISNVGYYNVDYFSFVSEYNIFVFDATSNGIKYEIDIRTRSFIFDQSLLKYKIIL